MTITSLFSPHPLRIDVVLATTPSTSTGDYALSRSDGGACSITITNAWLTGSNSVALSLSAPMLPGFAYLLSSLAFPRPSAAIVVYRQPTTVPRPPSGSQEDPEAEAFGVDLDWFADSLTGSGDLPTIRGRQCLVNDLTLVALISPGELFHRPDDGAALPTQVNGPMVPGAVSGMQSALKRQWGKDARVKPGDIQAPVDVSTVGQVTVNAIVTPVAIDEPLAVKVPSSS